ncbi:MAG: malectin domain-containing carbohydrate-binding protein [Chitinophagaceae bacterium]
MHRLNNYNDILVAGYTTTIERHGRTLQPRLFRGSIHLFVLLSAFLTLWQETIAQSPRQDINLNNNWKTIASADENPLPTNFYQVATNDKSWKHVNVPHNWDAYEGYRRLLHGNRHGDSWYRKTFAIKQHKTGKRFFLFFEGVSSYATVYVNGVFVGKHDGGRTTFTIDITDKIKTDGSANQLSVRAWHPAYIKDLPWVCGGCSDERGFSEGSQPMGIFRPVHLVICNDVRITPFGVHAWADITNDNASLSVNTTLKNYSLQAKEISVEQQLQDANGKVVAENAYRQSLKSGDSVIVRQDDIAVDRPILWSVENPYLYKIISTIKQGNVIVDQLITDFGFRTLNWKNATNQFFLNDKPVFINGIAEYEHLIGQSHAFTHEQIVARMKWIQSAGFNALRDAHQPHNLLYGQLCNKLGILWWTQLSAHIWYDTPGFRTNFKQLLKEWVIERRNDPAIILWGLQNESKLPEDFARECTELIRSLDPTASTQRLVTTCNGGSGTDWDVPQNWTGTYGGNPADYANDVKKQVLIGEYGAWRTLDLHTEGGFAQNGPLSEDRMTLLMEQKVRMAESVKDSCAGQFFWLLTSHDNPGRVQGGEGLRELDRVGPVNYKGILTPWEEPTDAYYMFRSNYASKTKEPMVYIVSHTWPSRWIKPGIKDSIIVYSNCDEVELFNDIDNVSLGRKKRGGVGTHFQWDHTDIQYNLLYAVGYVNGKAVAKDTIVLFHLPKAPGYTKLFTRTTSILKPQEGYHYLYRMNCGGSAYDDTNGNRWDSDEAIDSSQFIFGSSSWTSQFTGMPDFFASQRRTFSPIKETNDWQLFQDFRYGKEKLEYQFQLPNGEYLVELYFIEPWLGIGGGINAKGMRLFDVAVNGKTVFKDLDIWADAGTNIALKKIVKAKVIDRKMVISFPKSKVGQALVSAIAIASSNDVFVRSKKVNTSLRQYGFKSWMDVGDKQFSGDTIVFNSLPFNLYGAEWISFRNNNKGQYTIDVPAYRPTNVFVAYPKLNAKPSAINDYLDTKTEIITDENGGTRYAVFKKLYGDTGKVGLDIPGNCIVMMQPANTMQPAYDLKPIVGLRPGAAKLVGDALTKSTINEKETISFTNNTSAIEWNINIGAADIYSLTIRYSNETSKPLTGTLVFSMADGTIMKKEKIAFTPSNAGKWSYAATNTGGMINAGNYTVKIIADDAIGVGISGLDVQ